MDTLRHILLLIKMRWAYLLILAPILTDWIEAGHLPIRLREVVTEVVLGIVLAVCIRMIYREADQLRALAETDPLTGLFNRRRFFHDIVTWVARAHRQNILLSLAYMDVNDFKAINDKFGHEEGDKVLKEVSSLLQGSIRKDVDMCYRLGGDEFAVLLIGTGASTGLDVLLRARRTTMINDGILDRHKVTFSIGVAELKPEETSGTLIRRADRFMYAAKRRLDIPVERGACSARG